MKFTKIDRVNISPVCQLLLGEEQTFHMNHGGVTKIKPKQIEKGKELQTKVKRNQQTLIVGFNPVQKLPAYEF